MQFHQLTTKTKLKRGKRVGRGGKRGKTSGRGTKGQKARAGHRIRPEERDIIKKLPKRRGFGKNRARTVNDSVHKPVVINIGRIEASALHGSLTPKELITAGLVRRHKGMIPQIKLLSSGALTKQISVSGMAVSQSAREKIEKAGGEIL